jgi:hypothetical protein
MRSFTFLSPLMQHKVDWGWEGNAKMNLRATKYKAAIFRVTVYWAF